jgi:hypothetical protein
LALFSWRFNSDEARHSNVEEQNRRAVHLLFGRLEAIARLTDDLPLRPSLEYYANPGTPSDKIVGDKNCCAYWSNL